MFPGSPALEVTDRLVAFNPHDSYPPPLVDRLTLTMPVLNAGAFVFFQVTGADKAALVAQVLGPDDSPPLPAQRVHPTDGQLLWLLDVAVAGELPAE
jgi:6-phosphogluconolactonase